MNNHDEHEVSHQEWPGYRKAFYWACLIGTIYMVIAITFGSTSGH